MKPTFFPTPAGFRTWLAKNHSKATELLVGLHKKGSGRPSVTWPESVDQALGFGWIDGIRKRIDDDSYTIRFTPRRRRSIWSAVNIKRAGQLEKSGLMKPAGLEAFAAKKPNRSGIYSYEQRRATLPPPYAERLKKNKTAAGFFDAQSPWYRKTLAWWIVSARKEETRLLRLKKLIEESAQGRRLR